MLFAAFIAVAFYSFLLILFMPMFVAAGRADRAFAEYLDHHGPNYRRRNAG